MVKLFHHERGRIEILKEIRKTGRAVRGVTERIESSRMEDDGGGGVDGGERGFCICS